MAVFEFLLDLLDVTDFLYEAFKYWRVTLLVAVSCVSTGLLFRLTDLRADDHLIGALCFVALGFLTGVVWEVRSGRLS